MVDGIRGDLRFGHLDHLELHDRPRAGVWKRLRQYPGDNDSRGRNTTDRRRLRRLCLRVDGVPRAQCHLRHRRRADGGATSNGFDPDTAHIHDLRSQRDVPGRVDGTRRIRTAVGGVLVAELHGLASLFPHRVGQDRRGRPLQDLHPARRAALGAGAGLVRHLPVPLGVERLPGGACLPRVRSLQQGFDRRAGRPGGPRGGCPQPATRRCVCHDAPAPDRVLFSPAVLRAWPDRGPVKG